MLSLIICSKFPQIKQSLKENIAETIGCRYELIHIDNSDGKYSICQAYNEGLKRSRGDVLCFMHEDLVFHSPDWGVRVCHYLEDVQIGILGVAGAKVIPVAGDARIGGYFYNNVLPRYFTLEKFSRSVLDNRKPLATGVLNEVAAVDGLWLCMPKSIFRYVRFDADAFDGFHLYDMDISMQVQMTGRRVMICDDIVIEHLSRGIFDCSFSEYLEIFSSKWRGSLPLKRGIDLTDKQIEKFGSEAVRKSLERIRHDDILRKILDRKSDDSASFTPTEQKMINRSIAVYYRVSFQNSESISHSRCLLREFMKEQCYSLALRMDIFSKYLYYGLLKSGR